MIMKKEITMTEFLMEQRENLRKAELQYWQRLHPDAKVKLDKKRNEIVITYPLPKDYELLQKFVKPL